MIFGLTKFRTAGETQDTRFFELEFSWHGAQLQWNEVGEPAFVPQATNERRRLYAGFGDKRAGLCPRPGIERNG
jgi:hypothetical protein